ncbi:sigma-70 family RNA polymerase sigma factor [Mangrovibacterium lignilyticum]|uniref:sigma-70 family RNA polymerase sigma factor n=1 Tax=Mangrovibacterium lignilyticum TaxID=2668052 RepID=UPI0013D473A0|nr:sigma-70 family RNA polymerase sigma factor [Mangrovibacterium lignilyticum]
MTMFRDEVILDVLKSNKNEGIRMLFDQYYFVLVVYAEQFVKDRGVSEDIVQELFVRLWSHNYLEKIEPKDLRFYLYRSIKNTTLTHLGKNDLLRNPEELQSGQIAEEVLPRLDEVRLETVIKEVSKLSDRTREVVVKVMMEHKKYQEVADEMSISINTVKFLLKEGLKKIRSRLSFNDEE